MDNLKDLLDRIRAFAVARGWSKYRLAMEAGLSETVTRGMERDDWAPNAKTIRAIESLIPPGWRAGDPLPPETPPAVEGSAPASEAA